MPRFFFDLSDGRAEFRDETGIDLPQDGIVAEVRSLLRLLADERRREGRSAMVVADVRNEAGRIVFHATAVVGRG